eukprot:2977547-Pleurochrysis_carterae.AAC.1
MERRVRAEVRRVRLDFEAGMITELVKLKDDLLHMRRNTNYERSTKLVNFLLPPVGSQSHCREASRAKRKGRAYCGAEAQARGGAEAQYAARAASTGKQENERAEGGRVEDHLE